ncbi:unnamed protein product [Echinostoma caproni]|uniref:Ovule protein n=1 Tax=Echinostoma caproni TaxID=27848 RepID=A0A182ZZP1_9TREM|nr:unnamed protein product [Echinostoma caproni]
MCACARLQCASTMTSKMDDIRPQGDWIDGEICTEATKQKQGRLKLAKKAHNQPPKIHVTEQIWVVLTVLQLK